MRRAKKMEHPPEYAFCEPVTASSHSRWHIRKVGPEGLKLGGGASAPLCFPERGWDWINGWDLEVAITEQHLGCACQMCRKLYEEQKNASEGDGSTGG